MVLRAGDLHFPFTAFGDATQAAVRDAGQACYDICSLWPNTLNNKN